MVVITRAVLSINQPYELTTRTVAVPVVTLLAVTLIMLVLGAVTLPKGLRIFR